MTAQQIVVAPGDTIAFGDIGILSRNETVGHQHLAFSNSMSSEATQLKLRALELKKAGDLDGAKQLLAQARAIEFENITVEELNDAGELKRLAVVLKRKGDIAGAKRALAKAKSIEAAGDANVKPPAAAAPSAQQEQQRTSSPPRPSMAQQASARIPCLFNASSSPGKPGADEGYLQVLRTTQPTMGEVPITWLRPTL